MVANDGAGGAVNGSLGDNGQLVADNGALVRSMVCWFVSVDDGCFSLGQASKSFNDRGRNGGSLHELDYATLPT